MTRRDVGFMAAMEARNVKPGMVLGGVADLFKSEWLIESTASVVATREIEMTMTYGTRTITRRTAPDEVVLRNVPPIVF